jgi:hypothetical protein
MAQVRFLDQVPVGVFDPNTQGGGGQSVNIYYSSSLVLPNVPFINFTGSLDVFTGSISGSNGVTVKVVGFPYSGSAVITGSLILSGSDAPVLIVYGGASITGNTSITGSLNVSNGITGSISGSITGSFSGSVTAPGTTTQVVYNSGSVLGADSGFVYSGSRVGIGTSLPSAIFQVSGSINATSSLAQGVYFNNTISASANSDILVGLDINPSFNTGSFTGVSNFAARITGNTVRMFASSNGAGFDFKSNLGTITTFGGNEMNIDGISATNLLVNGGIKARVLTNGNFLLGTITDLGARLLVKGSGTTSSTTALLVQNANASASLQVRDDRNVQIYGNNGGGLTIGGAVGGESYYVNINASLPGAGNRGGIKWGSFAEIRNVRKFSGGNDSTLSFINGSIELITIQGTTSAGVNTNNVGINNTNPDISAILDVASTTRGFLLPRTNLTSNISSPAQGLQTYITASATEGIWYYNSGLYQGWTRVLNSSGSQSITGSLNVTSFTASNATITGNISILGTASISYLDVTIESASVIYSSGSNQFGDASNDTQTLYGTVNILTGPLNVSGAATFYNGITGSLSGSVAAPGSTTQVVYNSGSVLGADSGFVYSGSYVGIGTTTPSASLDVFKNNTGNIQNNNDSVIIKGNNPRLKLLGTSAGSSTGDGVIQFSTQDSGDRWVITAGGTFSIGAGWYNSNTSLFRITNSSGGNTASSVFLANADSDGRFSLGFSGTNGTPLSGFTGTGKLYISSTGLATPSAMLQVKGSGATSATTSFLVQNSVGTTGLTVFDNGNVSVGSATNSFYQLYGNGSWFNGGSIYTSLLYTDTISPSAGGSTNFYANINNFKIGTTSTATTSAVFEISSTTKGFLLPRTNLTSNISSPAQGLQTYITASATEGIWYYNSGSYQGWTRVLNDSGSQSITGSLTVTGGITGSFSGSGIITSASFALTASYVNPLVQNVNITGSLNVTGSGFILNPTNNPAGLNIVSSQTNAGSLVLSTIGSPGINNGAYLILRHADGTFPTPSSTDSVRIISTQDSQYFNGTSYITSTKIVDISEGQKIFGVTPSFGGTLTYYGKLSKGNWYFGDLSSTLNTARDTSVNARVQIKGSGATSSTTALLVQNANTSASLAVLDNGFVGIGTSSPAYNLDVTDTLRTTSNTYLATTAGFVGIGTTSPSATLHVQAPTGGRSTIVVIRATNSAAEPGLQFTNGSGNLSRIGGISGGGLFFENATTEVMRLSSAGNLLINTTTDAGFKLDVSGSGRFTNNLTVTGSFTVTTGSLIEFQVNQTGVKIGNATTDLHSVTGSIAVSASAGTGSALTVYKSGSTVMSIQGSQGELFSITDSLSGSLFSVSNISGLPILEVFSDNTVLLGNYLDPMLLTTQKVTANSGSTVIYSLPTASYDGVFMDYVIRSGSSARAGQFMGLWSGSSTNIVDSSTTDFGDTSGFVFALVVSGSNMVITGSASTSAWTVRAGIRSI